MRTEADRWLGALLHGWVELLSMAALLLAMLAVLGWCWNRGLRPAERRSLIEPGLVAMAGAAMLLVRTFAGHLADALIVSAALLASALMSRSARQGGLWLPGAAIGALLGAGLNLSASVLAAAVALVLLLSTRAGR
jgi:hypothetical protein